MTGTFDIKVLCQVGHPMPPAEFHAHFDDSEDMLLGRGVFDGISVVSFRKGTLKKYATICLLSDM